MEGIAEYEVEEEDLRVAKGAWYGRDTKQKRKEAGVRSKLMSQLANLEMRKAIRSVLSCSRLHPASCSGSKSSRRRVREIRDRQGGVVEADGK